MFVVQFKNNIVRIAYIVIQRRGSFINYSSVFVNFNNTIGAEINEITLRLIMVGNYTDGGVTLQYSAIQLSQIQCSFHVFFYFVNPIIEGP